MDMILILIRVVFPIVQVLLSLKLVVLLSFFQLFTKMNNNDRVQIYEKILLCYFFLTRAFFVESRLFVESRFFC